MALFFLLAALALGSSILVITVRSPVNSALWLILSLAGVAALFLTLGAEFIAILQVLVYAGAIMVLFLFVIMLLNLRAERVVSHAFPQKLAAVILGIGLLLTIGMVARGGISESVKGSYPAEQVAAVGNSEMVAVVLFSDYLFPFEIVSVLLIVAIVGAVVLARQEPGG